GRSIDCTEQPAESGDEEHGAEDADASNRVGGTMKDLRHRSIETKRTATSKRRGDVTPARRSTKPFELTAISNRGERFLCSGVFHGAVKNTSQPCGPVGLARFVSRTLRAGPHRRRIGRLLPHIRAAAHVPGEPFELGVGLE